MNCGAFAVKEFAQHYNIRFGDLTKPRYIDSTEVNENSNFYHPYAFIGIPGLMEGHGFESLRSNRGFFLDTGNVPPAEVLAIVEYSSFLGMYTFSS